MRAFELCALMISTDHPTDEGTAQAASGPGKLRTRLSKIRDHYHEHQHKTPRHVLSWMNKRIKKLDLASLGSQPEIANFNLLKTLLQLATANLLTLQRAGDSLEPSELHDVWLPAIFEVASRHRHDRLDFSVYLQQARMCNAAAFEQIFEILSKNNWETFRSFYSYVPVGDGDYLPFKLFTGLFEATLSAGSQEQLLLAYKFFMTFPEARRKLWWEHPANADLVSRIIGRLPQEFVTDGAMPSDDRARTALSEPWPTAATVPQEVRREFDHRAANDWSQLRAAAERGAYPGAQISELCEVALCSGEAADARAMLRLLSTLQPDQQWERDQPELAASILKQIAPLTVAAGRSRSASASSPRYESFLGPDTGAAPTSRERSRSLGR